MRTNNVDSHRIEMQDDNINSRIGDRLSMIREVWMWNWYRYLVDVRTETDAISKDRRVLLAALVASDRKLDTKRAA